MKQTLKEQIINGLVLSLVPVSLVVCLLALVFALCGQSIALHIPNWL